MKKKKEVYTTEIIDKLREIESMIKDFESDDIRMELASVQKVENNSPNCITGICTRPPLKFNSDSAIYKAILSLLNTEVYKLKKQLKESLDIGDNTHWELE